MRNIVVHQVVEGRGDAGHVESVVVRGVAFGLRRLEVSVRAAGPRAAGSSSASCLVETAPDGEFRARFDDVVALRAAGCACGGMLHVLVADANDREGCYSSIETRLVCDHSPERSA
jgi:hypothetical protein